MGNNIYVGRFGYRIKCFVQRGIMNMWGDFDWGENVRRRFRFCLSRTIKSEMPNDVSVDCFFYWLCHFGEQMVTRNEMLSHFHFLLYLFISLMITDKKIFHSYMLNIMSCTINW